jgi:peptidoglycan L-alanyl-D-glutamate endopeptidase CwlK
MLRKEDRLKGVDDRLVRVIKLAATKLEFDLLVVEGVRTIEKQREYVAKGASKTMNSKHIPTKEHPMGRAVDVAPVVDGKLRWDWPLFHIIAKAVKESAAELKVDIIWGGDWRTFKDGPHFELK